MKNGTGVKCVHPMCSSEDDLANAKCCQFMYTKWDEDKFESNEEVSNYLVALNRKNVPVLTTHPVVTVNHNYVLCI